MERFNPLLQPLAPDYLAARANALRRGARYAAWSTISLSLPILLLWLTQARWVENVAPFVLQMKANTALAFTVLGGALLALLAARVRMAIGLATLALLTGALTVLEYGGVGLSIDTLLTPDWSRAPGVYPGRTAPNSAVVFVLAGACCYAFPLVRNVRVRDTITRLCAAAIIAIGIEAMAGHIGDSPFAMGWYLQPMAIPSALCALALGGGLLAFAWISETAAITRLPFWVPMACCFAIALLDLQMERDVNIGIAFIPLVLCALWFERAPVAFVLAGVATLFIGFGLFATPSGRTAFGIVATNRLLDVAAVWIVATLVYSKTRARVRLRFNEQHFLAAQKLAAIGSFELDLSTMTVSGSAMFDEMHGLPVGRRSDWATFLRTAIPPDERDAIEAVIVAARDGRAPRDLEYTFVRPDGAVGKGVMHCNLLLDASHRPAAIIGVTHDVTALRLAMARRTDIEAQLRHAQRLESLGTVATGIAHDLNNTLVPITTLTPLLIERAGAPDLPILEVIVEAARRAKQLVREVLVFSGKEEAAHEPIRLDRLVREALTILRAGIPANITVVDDLEEVPAFFGSKGQIYQTILNLATNAAFAIGERPGTITIGTHRDAGGGADAPGMVHLFVADDGEGMGAATLKRIFEPYFTTKTRHGTGLGLSIVNGIVKSHGGSIAVKSTLGKGTRFDLRFPVLAAQPVS